MTAYTLTRSRRKTLAIHIKSDNSVEVRALLRLAKLLPPSPYEPGEFERIIRELVSVWGQRLGVTVYVGLRSMTSRWGSCTAKTRRIRLNAALEYCPRDCLESVVVQELAHLRENNHSPRFWAIVAGALPDYKARQKELKALVWLFNAEGDE